MTETPTDSDVMTYSPESRTRGLSMRKCGNCGLLGHEHDKQQAGHEDGRRRFDLVCPNQGDE